MPSLSTDEEEGINTIIVIKNMIKSTKRKIIRSNWDKEIKEALKTKGFKSVNLALKHALK